MSPVVKQTFTRDELLDMVVSVVGKDASRVQHALSSGAVVYNGYHYAWDSLHAEPRELAGLLSRFPDDDSNRPFDPATVVAVVLEVGGGVQRTLIEISKQNALSKKLFAGASPWDVLLAVGKEVPPRYEIFSHARHADLYRALLPFPISEKLVNDMRGLASRRLKFQWKTLRPPASITYISPRPSPKR